MTQYFSNGRISASVIYNGMLDTLDTMYWVLFGNTGLGLVLIAGIATVVVVAFWNLLASRL